MKLNNGAKALQWAARHGGAGERTFIGKVLANLAHNDLHPFVVWSMTSDDGIAWDCYHGNYCETITEAEEAFESRKV